MAYQKHSELYFIIEPTESIELKRLAYYYQERSLDHAIAFEFLIGQTYKSFRSINKVTSM